MRVLDAHGIQNLHALESLEPFRFIPAHASQNSQYQYTTTRFPSWAPPPTIRASDIKYDTEAGHHSSVSPPLLHPSGVEKSEPKIDPTEAPERWLTIHRHSTAKDAIEWLHKDGFACISLSLDDETSQPLDSVDFSQWSKICLLFGNEERGLSLGVRQRADASIYIPMDGFVQSYNVVVSCAFCLHHLRMESRLTPDLDRKQRNVLYRQWLLREAQDVAKHLRVKRIVLQDF